MKNHRSLTLSLGLCVLTAAAISGSHAAYLGIKAYAAQRLLERAWTKSVEHNDPAKPWQWADITASARLSYALHDGAERKSLIVLDNASGEAMAFGPGLVAGELANISAETIAVGGHRDTHLAFLEHANSQTQFDVQVTDGRTISYRFESSFVVDSRSQLLQISTSQPGLVLITCYPFNALQTGGPLRLVTRARLIDT